MLKGSVFVQMNYQLTIMRNKGGRLLVFFGCCVYLANGGYINRTAETCCAIACSGVQLGRSAKNNVGLNKENRRGKAPRTKPLSYFFTQPFFHALRANQLNA